MYLNKKNKDYIIENRFKNNKKLLNTRTIIFNIFHIPFKYFKLIKLKITAIRLKIIPKIVVLHLPSRKSGK